MCGIVGYVGNKPVVPLIIDGLRKLEYRGYDSAGIAVVNGNHDLEIRRAEGKLRNLEAVLNESPISGSYGVGHTRWATHGRPTEENAHPHRDCTGRVIVVHNGIIENYLQLKEELRQKDHRFVTETDTEIVSHLVEEYLKNGADFESAVRETVLRLRGIFALSIISADYPDTIISARQGPPVVMGVGDQEFFVASDVPAILEHLAPDVAWEYDASPTEVPMTRSWLRGSKNGWRRGGLLGNVGILRKPTAFERN